jgi:hypothetical protein
MKRSYTNNSSFTPIEIEVLFLKQSYVIDEQTPIMLLSFSNTGSLGGFVMRSVA